LQILQTLFGKLPNQLRFARHLERSILVPISSDFGPDEYFRANFRVFEQLSNKSFILSLWWTVELFDTVESVIFDSEALGVDTTHAGSINKATTFFDSLKNSIGGYNGSYALV
jgi:hypothetical protein